MGENIPLKTATLNKDEPVNPVAFLFLILPFGIIQGYLTVTLAFFYRKAGMSVQDIAGLVGISLLPSIFKFLWAPLVDLAFSVKKWYLLANIISASGLILLGIIPGNSGNIPLISLTILLSYFAATFVSLSVSSMMACDTPEEKKGLAGGFYNTGSVGGIGVGGGVALFLAGYLPSQWMVAAALAVICLLCAFTLLFVKEPQLTVHAEKAGKMVANLLKDVWATIKAKAGILALFLSFLPLGTGAAGSLFSAMANDWDASITAVALTTGFWGGIITAFGCLIAGWICDKINRQLAYILFGVFQAVCAVGMAYCPHTQLMYIIWTLTYSFANGFAYAGFSAFVLEAIGKGAAATKYNLYAGLSNIPIYLVTILDGWANTHWGAVGMLDIEAGCAFAGILLFFAIKALMGIKTNYPATVNI